MLTSSVFVVVGAASLDSADVPAAVDRTVEAGTGKAAVPDVEGLAVDILVDELGCAAETVVLELPPPSFNFSLKPPAAGAGGWSAILAQKEQRGSQDKEEEYLT